MHRSNRFNHIGRRSVDSDDGRKRRRNVKKSQRTKVRAALRNAS